MKLNNKVNLHFLAVCEKALGRLHTFSQIAGKLEIARKRGYFLELFLTIARKCGVPHFFTICKKAWKVFHIFKALYTK
jgi:hypothetical protein